MRINHNLAALNTYRQLSSNSASGARSLEKLSSGLRINKAGDDAAGLAISEKMRGQIRGLDQAARNAQDGISLIQTAEGGLSETQSILQRMKELATQAANGTNTDSDRGEIQKEMNQLSSEINRIGNTTEFNTQKLLNGGRQIDANAVASGAVLANGKSAVTHNMNVAQTNGNPATAASKTTTNNVTYATDISALDVNDSLTVTIDGTAFSVKGDALLAAKGAGYTDAASLAIWLSGNLKDAGNNAISTVANLSIDTGDLKIDTLSTNGTSSTIQLDTAGANSADIDALVGFAAGDKGLPNVAVGTDATNAYTTINFTGVVSNGSKINLYDGKVIAAYDSTDAGYTGMTTDQIKQSLSADYLLDIAGDLAAADSKNGLVALNGTVSNFTITSTGAAQARITYNAAGPQAGNMATLGSDSTAAAASGFINFTDKPTESSSITIGDKKIGFYDSSKETYSNAEAAKAGIGADLVVDTKGLTAQQVVDSIVGLNASLNAELTRDVALSRENKADGSVNLKVVAASTGFAGNLITLDASEDSTAGFEAKLQIGANYAQSMNVSVQDMRANALKVTGDGTSTTVTANDGARASYVAAANVTNGTTNTNVEYALDVSSHDKATAAISVLDDAIAAVSAERSKLGAFQNRLEHTINNLGTTSENLTASESRIRDVDMAKEMMEFTKNNILSQAAQAMLAQANQQPQGVLQLLR